MNDKSPGSENWGRKLVKLISGAPKSRESLFRTFKEARDVQLVDDETLEMMRRVVEVSDRQVEQVMVSRGADDNGRRQPKAVCAVAGHYRVCAFEIPCHRWR